MTSSQKRTRLNLSQLEARDVPNGSQLFAVSEDSASSRVAVYSTPVALTTPVSSVQYNLLAKFTPYPGFGGGVRTALGDVTGDGVDDLVTAPGFGGGAHIKIYDGAQLLAGRVVLAKEFFAFDSSFRGGAFVAIGQMDPATLQKEIVVGAGESGGPHVRVFAVEPRFFIQAPQNPQDYYAIHLTAEFFAFTASFRGGVRVASADVTGDGRADVIAAAGPGGGPHVRVFDVPPPNPLALYPYSHAVVDEFYAYDASFHGGVYVDAGELNGNTQFAEVVTSPGAGDPADATKVRAFARNSSGKLANVGEQTIFSTNGARVGIAALATPAADTLPGVQYVYAGYSVFGANPIVNKLSILRLDLGTLTPVFTGTSDAFSDRANAGIFVGV